MLHEHVVSTGQRRKVSCHIYAVLSVHWWRRRWSVVVLRSRSTDIVNRKGVAWPLEDVFHLSFHSDMIVAISFLNVETNHRTQTTRRSSRFLSTVNHEVLHRTFAPLLDNLQTFEDLPLLILFMFHFLCSLSLSCRIDFDFRFRV
jgi:hypothetical protein